MSLRLLTTHSLNILRKSNKGHFSGGKLHYRTETLLIKCSRQPISGKDQKYFDSFAQDLESLKLWTSSSTPILVDDIVSYKNKKYRVFRVQDYIEFNLKIDNYEVYAIEVTDDYEY